MAPSVVGATWPEVARHLDRLARGAHLFHRHAHHPLCDRYATEVVHLGGWIVCRGCLLAAIGGCAGLVVGCATVHSPPLVLVAVVLAVGLSLRRNWPSSVGKVWTRLLPAGAASAAVAGSVLAAVRATGWECVGWLLSTLLVSVAWFAWLGAYRRSGPNRSSCARCPEYGASEVCRGFRRIVSRERALRRVAGALLARANDATHAAALRRPAASA